MLRKTIALAALLLANLLTAEVLVIGGSDMLSRVFEGIESDGIKLELQGSISAVERVRDGAYTAAIIAKPGESLPQHDGLIVPFTYEVTSVIVNESNPLTEISFEQLGSIYGNDGEIDDWGAIVDSDIWKNRKISMGAVRQSESLAIEVFNNKVMESRSFRETVQFNETLSSIIRTVEDDRNFIALVPGRPEGNLIKHVGVKVSEDGQAFTPSEDNVVFGDYPLRLTYYLIIGNELSESEVAKITDFLFSDSVSESLKANGYMPLPEREKQAYLN